MPKFDGSKPGPGRPPGKLNVKTQLVRDFAEALLSDTGYTAYVKHRIMVGQAAPQLELYFWQLCGGKPKEQVELTADLTGNVRVVHEYHSS